MVTNIILPDNKRFNYSLATNYREIREFSNNNLAISSTVLGNLREQMNFTQLRFICLKKNSGQTFHFVTKRNTLGKLAVEFFTVGTTVIPKACGSFSSVRDHYSIMATNCTKWGYEDGKYQIDKWSSGKVPDNNRLVNFVSFITGKARWLFSDRGSCNWDCDDHQYRKGAVQYAISAGDFWKIYVR